MELDLSCLQITPRYEEFVTVNSDEITVEFRDTVTDNRYRATVNLSEAQQNYFGIHVTLLHAQAQYKNQALYGNGIMVSASQLGALSQQVAEDMLRFARQLTRRCNDDTAKYAAWFLAGQQTKSSTYETTIMNVVCQGFAYPLKAYDFPLFIL